MRKRKQGRAYANARFEQMQTIARKFLAKDEQMPTQSQMMRRKFRSECFLVKKKISFVSLQSIIEIKSYAFGSICW